MHRDSGLDVIGEILRDAQKFYCQQFKAGGTVESFERIREGEKLIRETISAGNSRLNILINPYDFECFTESDWVGFVERFALANGKAVASGVHLLRTLDDQTNPVQLDHSQ